VTRPQTYYDILGVSPTATPSEIRTAYVRLMKRHHPDAVTSDYAAPDLAPVLNRCYAVVRDPDRRAQYDAQLFRLSPMPSPMPRLYRTDTRTRSRSRLWRMAAAVSAFAVVAVVGLASRPAGDQVGNDVISEAMRAGSPPLGQEVDPPVYAPLPDHAEARDLATLARTLSIPQAEQFSRECFAAARVNRNVVAGETCVVFDVAFLYWRVTPSRLPEVPVHFADQVVIGRHRDMVARYGAAAEARLRALRRTAFAAVSDSLSIDEPPSNQSALAVSAPPSAAESSGE
jgi:curved DNA-binding protein CbpA